MHPACILVVEDEVIIAAVIEKTLKKFGYKAVVVPGSGEEAVEKALTLLPDLILMDIRLHGPVDGIAAAEAIQAQKDIPIIYLTAYADEKTLERAKKTQPYGYIPKPFQEIELKTAIEVGLYKHQMEIKLKESEAKFRSIFENSVDAIFLADSNGNLLEINPAGEHLLGRSLEELRSIPYHQIFASSKDQMHFIDELKQKRVLKDYGIQFIRKDGTPVDVLENINAFFDQKGELTGFQGIMRDVTEKKKREEMLLLLQTAISSSAEAVIITDRDGRIVYTNPAFTKMTGYGGIEVLGKNPHILKSGQQRADFYHQLWETISGGSPWSGEFINRRKDGSLYTQRSSISPVFNEKGEISHYVGIATDITREKKLEQQLVHVAKMDSLGRLAGGIAHDFNNLLVVINGYAEMLMYECTDESLKEKIKLIFRAGQNATRLVTKILAFSRKQSLEPAVVNINDAIVEFDRMLNRIIGENIEVKLELAPDIRLVWIDIGQLEQAIMNLVVNAKDAMPRGGLLTIATTNRILDEDFVRENPGLQAGEWVELRISDTGCGMEPEIQKHIFEPFFTTKKNGEGTGLGLPIVYGILKQHNGFVAVKSEPGKGTEFSLFLPVCKGEAAAADSLPDHAADISFSGKTVLLVEDDEQTLLALGALMGGLGFHVLFARDGEEAVKTAQEYEDPIDLLLCDVILPGIYGIETAEGIMTSHPEIRILFSSGYPPEDIARRGIKLEKYHIFKKPITRNSIQRKLKEIFEL